MKNKMKKLLIALAGLLSACVVHATDLVYEVKFSGESGVRVQAKDKCDGYTHLESNEQWADKPIAKLNLTCFGNTVFGEVYISPKTFLHFTGPAITGDVPNGYDVRPFKADLNVGDSMVLGPSADKAVVTVRRIQ